VYKTSDEWFMETGLTYRQQATARTLLKNLGILSETEKRLEHKLYFKLNIKVFDLWFENCINSDQNPEQKKGNSRNEDSAIPERQIRSSGGYKSAIRGEANAQSVIHKITTEITTESESAENPCIPENPNAKPEENSVEHTLKIWTPNFDSLNSWLQRSGLPKITQAQAEEILLELNPHYENKIHTGAVSDTQMYSNFVKWVKRDNRLTEKLFEQATQSQPAQAQPQNLNLPEKPKGFLGARHA